MFPRLLHFLNTLALFKQFCCFFMSSPKQSKQPTYFKNANSSPITTIVYQGPLIYQANTFWVFLTPLCVFTKCMNQLAMLYYFFFNQFFFKSTTCSNQSQKNIQVINFQKVCFVYHFIKQFEWKFYMTILLYRIICQILQ